MKLVAGSLMVRFFSWESRETNTKVPRVIVAILFGFAILFSGVWLINSGLTAVACPVGVVGVFDLACHRRIDYSLVTFGTIIFASSAPIFLLAWKAYRSPAATTLVREGAPAAG